jgi:hypothetical protein
MLVISVKAVLRVFEEIDQMKENNLDD